MLLVIIFHTSGIPANVAVVFNINEETASFVTVQDWFMDISHIAKAAAFISLGHSFLLNIAPHFCWYKS